jgi:hypothetical protein
MDPLNGPDLMSFASPAPSRKRSASTLSPTTSPSPSSNPGPVILSRRHHRRTNIAAQTWGPSIPLTPSTAFPHADFALKPSTPNSSSHEVSSAPFNIYAPLLAHPTLFPSFVFSLPLSTAINLYAIDKHFHLLFNKYYVSLIHDYARSHCPISSHIFSWSMYPQCCISDPMLRPMDERSWLARDVPGWRWIGMCCWRQGVVRSILTRLARGGMRVPVGVEVALYKFWVLMETPKAAVRAAYLADRAIWTDANIAHFHLFLVKLDMYFANPILGNGAASLSHLLLSQKSLSTLYHVLTGRITLTYDTTSDMIVRTYLTADLDTDTFSWIDDEIDNGISEEYWGILMKENWDEEGERMECALDMVVAEGVGRELHVQRHFLDFVKYGYVNGEGKNEKVVRGWRGDRKTVEREGWPRAGVREKTIKDLDERFGVVKMGKCGVDKMDAMGLSI